VQPDRGCLDRPEPVTGPATNGVARLSGALRLWPTTAAPTTRCRRGR